MPNHKLSRNIYLEDIRSEMQQITMSQKKPYEINIFDKIPLIQYTQSQQL